MKRIQSNAHGNTDLLVSFGDAYVLFDVVSEETRIHERRVMNTHRVLAGPSWRETVRIVSFSN